MDVLSLQKVSQIGVNVTYTFTATSGISSNQLISRLASSVFSGLFLTSLKSNSGIAITRQSGFIAQNLSPTFDPSATPSNAPSEAPVGAVQVIEKRPGERCTTCAALDTWILDCTAPLCTSLCCTALLCSVQFHIIPIHTVLY